jgi:HlyD family secretion protein
MDQSAPTTETIPGDSQPVNNADVAVEDTQITDRQKWAVRIGAGVIVLLIGLAFIWYYNQPTGVNATRPTIAAITEAIAGSGVVGGETESNIGAQAQGIVRTLYVKEGDEVIRGQELALIENSLANAQIEQARAAVVSAKSQLALVSRAALPTDIRAAEQQVAQARAQVEQQRAALDQAEKAAGQASALLDQLVSEQQLAEKEMRRDAVLLESGDVPRSQYDRSSNAYQVASKRVEAQRRAIEAAQANVVAARSSLASFAAGVEVQRERLNTIRSGARPEDVRLARDKIAEAERALAVAESQAGNAVVTAPFAGRVTMINAEPGQTVGNLGVLTLVSSQPEVRLDVDESNLPSLKIGLEARIAVDGSTENTLIGHISELAAAVDEARGTITVKITLDSPPERLRPGQTVNVNIITAENVDRLLIPRSSLVRVGDDTVVFVIEDGRAVRRTVAASFPTADGVPVISGLNPEDLVITNPANVVEGGRVRAR